MSHGTPQVKIADTGWSEAIMWRLGLRRSVVVQGDSMSPLLLDGDELLVSRKHRPKVNNIVVAKHPTNSAIVLIKLVEKVRDGEFYLAGVNQSSSSDSRDFGWLSNDHMIGLVTSRISP